MLLLGYKGGDPALHLGVAELTALLDACRFSDTSLGVTRFVAKILSAPGALVRTSPGSDAT